MADRPTSRNKKPIIISILSGSVLVILLGLFFLPRLTSTHWAADKIQQAVNTRVPGQFNFEDLSLSWFNGIHCRGVTYKNPAQGIQVNVAEVTTAKGLLALAANYRQFGAVNIIEPKIYVTLNEKFQADGAGDNPAGQQGENSPGRQDGSEKAGSKIAFPGVEGQLNISGGEVVAVLPDTSEKPVIKALDLQLKVVSLERLLDYLVAFQSGDGSGRVNGTGSVTLPTGDAAALEKIQSQATLAIENWELTDLLTILAATGGSPSGSGLINGEMIISGSTESGLDIKGNLIAEKITLQGGPLKTDTPSLDRLEVEMDARKTTSDFTINHLSLQSALASGKASGTISGLNRKEMEGEAVIDLAQLFAQFPATLNLKKGIRILTGQIGLNAKLTASDTTTFFSGRARVDEVRGVADDKKISWDQPVSLEARGEQGPDGLRLENFAVKSSFVNGSGQGDMNQMEVILSADIGAALKEIEKFIDTQGWASTGDMDIRLQVNTKNPPLRAVTGDVTIHDFVLQQKDDVIAPRGGVKANLVTDLRLDSELRPQEMLNTAVKIQSWLGSGAITVERFVPPAGQAGVQARDLRFQGGFDLDRLSTVLQTLNALPRDTRLSGQADLETRLSASDEKLDLEDTTITVSDFLFEKAGQKAIEKNIHLATRGSADLKKKTALLAPFEISAATGRMTFPEVAVTNWSQLVNGVRSHGTIDLDLGLLSTVLGDFLPLPGNAAVTGKASVNLNIDMTRAEQQVIQLASSVENLKIHSKDNPPLIEDLIQLAIVLSGDVGEQKFTFDKMEISTAPISLKATGTVAPEKNERILTSEGSITVDLQAAGRYLKSLADLELEMKGAAARPFVIEARSTNRQWSDLKRKTDLTTSFQADYIRGFGMIVESLDVPVKLAKGHGNVVVQGTVNKGRMSIKPAVNFTVDPAEVTLPENSVLLTGVGLTEDMSNDLLGHIHPIFKGAAVSRGTVDLAMRHFRWPLDEAARKDAAFAGSLVFNDVKLQPGGLLEPLLAVMEMDGQEITLGNQPMEFVGENERIRCTPMEISVNEYTLKLSGTIGFDKSLDYIAQIPVTRKMVSGDIYKYLEGTFITVPIGGTVAKPAISKNVVQRALQDLAVQAGKKELTDQAGKLLQKLFQ